MLLGHLDGHDIYLHAQEEITERPLPLPGDTSHKSLVLSLRENGHGYYVPKVVTRDKDQLLVDCSRPLSFRDGYPGELVFLNPTSAYRIAAMWDTESHCFYEEDRK